MSQPFDENTEHEKKLNRRPWQSLLLMFVVDSLIMMGVVAITMLIGTAASANTSKPLMMGLAILGLVLMLGLLIGSIGFSFYLWKWSMKPEQQRLERSAPILQRVLPGVSLENETKAAKEALSPGWLFRLSIVMIIAFIVIAIAVVLIERGFDLIWPTAPESLKSIITLALVFIGSWIIGGFIGKRRTKKPTPDSGSVAVQPFQPSMSGAQIVQRWLAMGFFFAFIFFPTQAILNGIMRLVSHPLLGIPVVFGSFLLTSLLLFSIYTLAPHFWIMPAVRHANYDEALRRARLAQKLSAFRGPYLTWEGIILQWSGHPEEARQLFVQSLKVERREIASSGSVPLQNVGCALTALGHYDEAIQFLESAIAIKADRGSVFNDLAEAYLRQGVEAQRALELTDRALPAHRASFEERWLSRFTHSEILANRAWALALLGRHAEAEQVLQQAFKVAPHHFIHVQAGLHYRAGRIQQLRADPDGAREHYQTAQRLEPNGSYGQLAAQALITL